jgi:hypothetical protein
MASIKYTHNCSGVFPKLKVVVAFLKYAKVAMASIQLTLSEKSIAPNFISEIVAQADFRLQLHKDVKTPAIPSQ